MRRMMRNRQRDDRADRAETARDDEGDPEQDRTEKSEGVVHQRRLQPEQAARQPRQIFVIFAKQRRETGFAAHRVRSEEHTSELQSLMRISYAVFCLKKKKQEHKNHKKQHDNNMNKRREKNKNGHNK